MASNESNTNTLIYLPPTVGKHVTIFPKQISLVLLAFLEYLYHLEEWQLSVTCMFKGRVVKFKMYNKNTLFDKAIR